MADHPNHTKPRQRLLSGMQPTGLLHIGNYLGAIRQFVDLQNNADCFFMVADLHALTTTPTPKDLTRQTIEVVRYYLACGIDPGRSTIFLQSQIHEHAELAWILGNYSSVGELERMTQYKEKVDLNKMANAGLLTYPILMAADILLYQTDKVPVGDDQTQHLELTRAIAKRFNQRYGRVFREPEPLLNQQKRVMALNDPTKKMSKSLAGSYIALSDSPEVIRTKIRSAVTDSKPAPGAFSPGVKNLFSLADAFVAPAINQDLKRQYQTGTLHYFELKEQLAQSIIDHLRPIQDRARSLNDREIISLMTAGQDRAQPVAAKTLQKVKESVGLITA